MTLTIPCIILIQLLGKCIRIENEAKEKKLELKNSKIDMVELSAILEELVSDSEEEDEKEADNKLEVISSSDEE